MKNTLLCFLAFIFFISCNQEKITIHSLLLEMVDRENIARYPDPAFTLKQFSSYDRASVDPNDSAWYANWDRSMFISEEAGMFHVDAHIPLSPVHGKFRISINSKMAPEVLNAYSNMGGTQLVDLGNHSIRQGENEIIIEIVGYSPDKKQAFFGLNYLIFNKEQ